MPCTVAWLDLSASDDKTCTVFVRAAIARLEAPRHVFTCLVTSNTRGLSLSCRSTAKAAEPACKQAVFSLKSTQSSPRLKRRGHASCPVRAKRSTRDAGLDADLDAVGYWSPRLYDQKRMIAPQNAQNRVDYPTT